MIYATNDNNYHATLMFCHILPVDDVKNMMLRIDELKKKEPENSAFQMIEDGLKLFDGLPKVKFGGKEYVGVYRFTTFRAQPPSDKDDGWDLPKDQWGWENASKILNLGTKFFSFVKDFQSTYYAKTPYRMTRFRTADLKAAVSQKFALEQGALIIAETNAAKDLNNLIGGTAVAVYINGEGFMGRNKTISSTIAAAQTYDSLEAAQRSVKAYQNSYTRRGKYDNITYVEIETKMKKVITSTKNVDENMRVAMAHIQRKEMIDELQPIATEKQTGLRKKM